MAHARADAKPSPVHSESPQRLDPVDVHKMRRARQTKRHDRHEALAPREHAPIFGRNLGQRIDCFFDRLGGVIAEPRGLHRSSSRIRRPSKQGRTITARRAYAGTDFFGLRHNWWCM